MRRLFDIEWPTLALLAVVYAVWGGIVWADGVPLWVSVPILAITIALHGSLQHEAMHGHPTRVDWINTALASPPLTLVIPYLRFRDTHLDHHRDADLTDPYDDPESHFMDPATWHTLAPFSQTVLNANNTLAGRMLLGPAIGTVCFLRSDWRARKTDARIVAGWAWHAPAMLAVLAVVWAAPLPIWAYLLGVYLALSLLRIRTFLEHRAHAQSRARSVIIEDRGPLAWLFLNNNLHAVHHANPDVAWYKLPALYRARSKRFLTMNDGYRFQSYGEVFQRYLFRRKDPVPHPLRDG